MQLGRMLQVSQKTAWFLLHRLREFSGQVDGVLSGVVEVDETFVGGRRKTLKQRQRGDGDKQPVFGMRERGGRPQPFLQAR